MDERDRRHHLVELLDRAAQVGRDRPLRRRRSATRQPPHTAQLVAGADCLAAPADCPAMQVDAAVRWAAAHGLQVGAEVETVGETAAAPVGPLDLQTVRSPCCPY